MTKTVVDASVPSGSMPAADVVIIYAGGDTPHVWTDAEIAARTERYRLPAWVRSNPAGVSGTLDADIFVEWLRAHDCPPGVATVLDLETAIAPKYVSQFGDVLHAAGWLVLPYGSRDTLESNPQLDGYFDAHPGETLGTVDPGDVATQDVFAGAYDESTILDSVPLWDTRPPPVSVPVVPTAPPKEALMQAILVNGTPTVYAASPAGHLLEFTKAPGSPGGWSVIDVTDEVATAFPGVPPFTVQP